MLNPPPTGQVADTSRFEIQDTADGIFATLVINSATHRHFRRKAKFVPVSGIYNIWKTNVFDYHHQNYHTGRQGQIRLDSDAAKYAKICDRR